MRNPWICLAALGAAFQFCGGPTALAADPVFPVKPELFIDKFRGSEGMTFNGEGRLFIGANNAVWIASPTGEVRKIAEVGRHLGQAGIGSKDILAADFGDTNFFETGPNDDGVVWRITPEGQKKVFAKGIGDPNAVLLLRDGSLLVTDDATDKIYVVKNGVTAVWSQAVPFPNGIALSADERTLYVAQSFKSLKPAVPDDSLWAIPIREGKAGDAKVVYRTGAGAVDGLVADAKGRIYIADNGSGRVVRFDPSTGKGVVIAEGLPNVASLVFGEGKFDHRSIYATSTERGGGRTWRIPVGVRGAKPHR